MASYGKAKETMPVEPRAPKKELLEMRLRKAKNGGVVVEHQMTTYDGKPEIHAFGGDEGHKLAAHVEKHMGITMPGKTDKESMETAKP